MIYTCPHCGQKLSQTLKDGITSCTNCERVFDSNFKNKLLSAAWVVRNENPQTIEKFQLMTKLSVEEAVLVYSFVFYFGYSHDEFLAAIKKLGLCES